MSKPSSLTWLTSTAISSMWPTTASRGPSAWPLDAGHRGAHRIDADSTANSSAASRQTRHGRRLLPGRAGRRQQPVEQLGKPLMPAPRTLDTGSRRISLFRLLAM